MDSQITALCDDVLKALPLWLFRCRQRFLSGVDIPRRHGVRRCGARHKELHSFIVQIVETTCPIDLE